uniref:Uncharacterized protein n=1 Tax=Picea sitchensis TaxID=3332 RepID=A0A6B9XR82_PICSI|nr:hypothetical protein Q903MT_gene4142 [Picea sitchensis]
MQNTLPSITRPNKALLKGNDPEILTSYLKGTHPEYLYADTSRGISILTEDMLCLDRKSLAWLSLKHAYSEL